MEVRVMTKEEVEGFIVEEHDENILLISIRTPKCLPINGLINNVDNGIQFILSLSFADPDTNTNGRCISERDANKIARIISYSKDINSIIVNCDYGKARSLGIAAAIDNFFNGDSALYGEYKEAMSTDCYNYTLQALNRLNKREV